MPLQPFAPIHPVILCGGAGTRLWPVSREQFPKQFLPLTGERSLLQQTSDRLGGAQFASTLIVSGEDQRFLIERELRDAGAKLDAILLEPMGRNTAPAAALAAAWLEAAHGDELMLLMPSDHVIGDPEAFLRAIKLGASHAQDGAIVTFGATPTEPNTQYGYIEADGATQVGDGAYRIARFHEKPNARLAAEYVETGRFFWNCGIFLAKAGTVLSEMRRFLPETLDNISQAVSGATREGLFVRPVAELFSRAENISIDNGIMEKTSRGVVVPVQMQWSDVGAWDAVWKLSEKDEGGNAVQGKVVAFDCANSLIRNDGRTVVGALGLERIAVIAVDDAVFVAPLDRSSEVKQLVAELKHNNNDVLTRPAKAVHGWGSCEQLGRGLGFQVSHLIVEPSGTLSQPAVDATRQWVIVSGSAELMLGGELSLLSEKDSILIAAGTDHALTNRAASPLSVLQIQFGL